MSEETGSETADSVKFPGARRPDRRRRVEHAGVSLSVAEWGDPQADPVVVAHGGFDFAETLNVFAPMIADAGWRVVSWDQRGHGDSDRTALYSWDADLRDAVAVIDSVSPGPLPLIGHSKGGSLLMYLAGAMPSRVSALVNLDGLPSWGRMSDVADRERSRSLRRELSSWLEHRRTLVGKERKPGSIDDLARRRGRMNPRLSQEWLRYLVTVGAVHSEDGWRWKIDPTMRLGGFGPFQPEWALQHLPGLAVPFLGVLGLEDELMGWGTRPEHVGGFLPPDHRFETLEGVGHFVHIEQPRRVADLVCDFLS
ncbi:MAG: alpha/beta hydrolase [Actinobacteria bacterium]|nr:alpha/beta hydrolase [Actinomycetota bacterium]